MEKVMNKLPIKLFVIIAVFHGILSYFLFFKSLSIPLRSLCDPTPEKCTS
ncbi:MAG: hypothetical protein BWY26_01250 [Elusimicrobia bacterium ADurb.Bin231]|nr:MAG: hypothetical protein BWY26_01250 [Elusimicrobia bacterium ADurb.Bin231]